MNWLQRHRLLAESMRSPLSAWREYEQNEAGTTFEFDFDHPIHGYVGVRCEDSENGEEAGLICQQQASRRVKRAVQLSHRQVELVGQGTVSRATVSPWA